MYTPVQLGWIQDAINWVFDKILQPVFKWVSSLLSDVFNWVFENILGPILQKFFEIVIKLVAKLLWGVISRILFRIEVAILSIVDMMQNIYNVLAGTAPVKDVKTGMTGSLLSILARKPFIVNSMLLIIAVSFVLCFAFAIAGVLKSMSDMGGPGSKSVGHVLRKTAQALLRMLIAPALGLFLIVLGDAVLTSMTRAMTLDNDVTIARSLFVISTLDAVDDEKGAVDQDGRKYGKGGELLAYNYSTRPAYLASHPGAASDYGLKDKFRRPFYNGTKNYTKAADVDPTFNMGRINFIVGIGGAILFIFILGTSLFVFTSRIFDVLVLLLIEPFFIATMPLDDGEHFQKWEDMFIAKIFSGYGMVVAMYLYLLISAMVFEGKISFTPQNGVGDILMDMLMKIILLVGGAATVLTAGPLITSLLNSAVAMQEGGAAAAGMAFTGKMMDLASKPVQYGMGKLKDAAVEGIGNAFSGIGGGAGGGAGGSGNQFTGSKPSTSSSNTPSGPPSSSSGSSGSGPSSSSGGGGTGSSPSGQSNQSFGGGGNGSGSGSQSSGGGGNETGSGSQSSGGGSKDSNDTATAVKDTLIDAASMGADIATEAMGTLFGTATQMDGGSGEAQQQFVGSKKELGSESGDNASVPNVPSSAPSSSSGSKPAAKTGNSSNKQLKQMLDMPDIDSDFDLFDEVGSINDVDDDDL